MSYDQIKFGNKVYRTGNLLPPQKVRSFPRFPIPLKSQNEIREILNDKNRLARREQFGREWIYDQGNIGSCNGCAAAKALERARVLAGMPQVILSGEFVYQGINDGRDVGSMLDDGMKYLMENGAAPWKAYHQQKYRESDFRAEDFRDAERYKALECYGVDTEDELATALALGFIAVIAVHANNDFMRIDGNGIAGGINGVGNHAVGVDDAKVVNGQILFDMFNSWGTQYGDNGRAYLTWERHLKQTSKNHYFYVIRATTSDTQDDIPEIQKSE